MRAADIGAMSWWAKLVTVGAAVWGMPSDVERTPPVRRPARRDARLLLDIVDGDGAIELGWRKIQAVEFFGKKGKCYVLKM